MNSKLDKLDRLEEKLDESMEKMEKLTKENKELRTLAKNQEERICTLEREINGNKIVIYGIKEEKEETEDNLKKKTSQIIQLLGVEVSGHKDIQEIRRLGEQAQTSSRPVQLEFKTKKIRNEVLKEKKKLKVINKDIWIEETYSKNVLMERKELLKYMKEERSKGNTAYIRYNKISIQGNLYTLEEVKERNKQVKTNTRTFSQRSPNSTDENTGREKIRFINRTKTDSKN